MARIVVECLTCRHRAVMSDRDLQEHGSDSWISLVTLTKRMVCGRCGSRAVKAYREEGGGAANRSLVQERSGSNRR
jgi:hypothetical protein